MIDNVKEVDLDDEILDKETVDENMMEIDNCQCGEQNKSGNFECNVCGKIFCEKCPNRPVETQCIECMLVETNLVTSTPIKKH